MYYLLFSDNNKQAHLHSSAQRFLTGLQTDAQKVLVDDTSLIRKLVLLIM